MTYDLQQRINHYRQGLEWLQRRLHLPEVLASIYANTFERGGTVWFVGNGGSAADCQHLAAEYVNGMAIKGSQSRPLNARALTVDTSVLTAIGNDRGFDSVFLRQLQAGVRDYDTVVAHSTSGRSSNLVNAFSWLRSDKPKVARVALLGHRDLCGDSMLAQLASPIFVDAEDGQAVQVTHMMLEHLTVEVIEHWATDNWRKTDPIESHGV